MWFIAFPQGWANSTRPHVTSVDKPRDTRYRLRHEKSEPRGDWRPARGSGRTPNVTRRRRYLMDDTRATARLLLHAPVEPRPRLPMLARPPPLTPTRPHRARRVVRLVPQRTEKA